MTRVVPTLLSGVATGALALGLCAAAGSPAHAGGLKVCNDYVKAKNVSCRKASTVAEKGLATMLDQDSDIARFEGWTCRMRDQDDRAFRCVKKVDGTTMLVKYRSA